MRKHVATILGFLIAPLFATIALLVVGAANRGADPLHMDTSALVWGVIFYCYTLGVTLIIGLPAYFFLRRFNKVTWWSATLMGLLSGGVMVSIFNLYFFVVVPIGGLSGFIFWLIESKTGAGLAR